MKRTRRKFTTEFKRELVQKIAAKTITKKDARMQYQLSPGLLDRWINDVLARDKLSGQVTNFQLPQVDRRDNSEVQNLKLVIADLYVQLAMGQRKSFRPQQLSR